MTIEIPVALNIAQWLLDRNLERPDDIAIVSDAHSLTFSQLATLVDRVGYALKALNCSKGDRVLIVLPDSVEFIASFLGAVKIGALAVPVSPKATQADYAFYVSDSGPEVAIVSSDIFPTFSTAAGSRRPKVIVVGEERDSSALPSWNDVVLSAPEGLDAYPTAATDSAFLLYTSGTTAHPKAALHRHQGMFVTSQSFARHVLSLRREDRTLSVSKLFFAYGLGNGMYYPLAFGASTVMNPNTPTISAISALIQKYRPTILFAVPTFYRAVLQEVRNGQQLDLSSVRLAISAGEPLPPALYYAAQEILGIELLDGLGSTEMLQTFISNRPGATHPGTCGIEVPNYEVRIVDDEGKDVIEGVPGELWVRGGSAFVGYWNDQTLTDQCKRGDWNTTGDIVRRNSDGCLEFCGRMRDTVKMSGIWISLSRIEMALCSFPKVERALVIVRDGTLLAYVTPTADSEVTIGELRSYLRGILPRDLLPNTYSILNEFPLTPNGKIDRFRLPSPELVGSEISDRPFFRAPETDTEKWLARVWEDILHVKRIGIDDDFVELGGHSIIAIQCLNRIARQFEVEFPLDLFFSDSATLSRISHAIDRLRATTPSA